MKSIIVFGMLVKVIAGFYTGCKGVVTDHSRYNDKTVFVQMSCKMGDGRSEQLTEWIDVKDLQEVK